MSTSRPASLVAAPHQRPTCAAPLLALLAVALSCFGAGSCSGKDWDQEIVVRVYRSRTLTLDRVFVTATQEKVTRSLEVLGPFDCTNNQLRIIPRQVNGAYPPVHLTVATSDGKLKSERDLTIPAPNPVRVVLGSGGAIEPADCAQGMVPDAGPPPVKRKTGEACINGGDCEGGVCLLKHPATGVDEFPNGYCSHDCKQVPDGGSGDLCLPATELCLDYRDGNGNVVARYCMKRCQSGTDCRKEHQCTPGNLCYPYPPAP